MIDSLVKEVLEDYPTGRVFNVSRIKSGRNTNYFVSAEKGDFFLRERNPRLTTMATFFHEADIVSHLVSNGFNTAPIIHSKNGESFVKKGKRFFRLYEYVHGSAYSGKRWQDKEIARMLAEYHSIMDSFDGFKPQPIDFLRWSVGNLKRIRRQVSSENYVKLRKALNNVIREIQSYGPKLPHTIIHGDVQPSNMRFRGKRVYLFDFDEIRWGAKVADVADLLIYFACLDYRKIKQENLLTFIGKCSPNRKKIDFFLTAYSKAGDITDNERRMLPFYMTHIWLAWLIWTMANVECAYDKHIRESLQLIEKIKNLDLATTDSRPF
jgi:Ser/Thr protein kinase RdoA (MazF antagonist)